KTSRSRWSADQAEDSATQLLLYLELARLLVPEKEVRVQFTVLTKAKAPAVETYPVAADQRVATGEIVPSLVVLGGIAGGDRHAVGQRGGVGAIPGNRAVGVDEVRSRLHGKDFGLRERG